jgi:hypothetical protein
MGRTIRQEGIAPPIKDLLCTNTAIAETNRTQFGIQN